MLASMGGAPVNSVTIANIPPKENNLLPFVMHIRVTIKRKYGAVPRHNETV